MFRTIAWLLFGVPFLALLPGADQAQPETTQQKKENEPRRIPAFTVTDTLGRAVTLPKSRAVVVVFSGVDCPLVNAYLPRLKELHEEFGVKGATFIAFNSNAQDSPAAVARHAADNKLPFPVVKDPGQKFADLFAARRTPEVFVLDQGHAIRYQGRIDNQYGIGGSGRVRPGRRDLAEAVREVLAGQPVSVPVTKADGCLIGRVPLRSPPANRVTVTYTRDVAPILQSRCESCHRPGEIGPFTLHNFDQARAWSDMIREVVAERRMPPWQADHRFGQFSNDRSLTRQERETVLNWIDQGCAKGDERDLPSLPERKRPESGNWRIGKPDLVLTMENAFAVPAKSPKGGIPYQRFKLKTDFSHDVWVRQAEARPGQRAVVHHMRALLGQARKINDQSSDVDTLTGFVPGGEPMRLPEGVARRLPRGATIELEMHYTANGVAKTDRSSIGLIVSKEPPRHQARTRYIANRSFAIPAGDADYEVKARTRFDRPVCVLDLLPHMHLRGKSFEIVAVWPDGKKKEILLSVPRYDFHWQTTYYLQKPLLLPADTIIECTARFDNSAANSNNPDPEKEVRWGDQSWEEMMLARLTYYYPDENPPKP